MVMGSSEAQAQQTNKANALRQLFASDWEFRHREHPETATWQGDHRYDQKLTDLSPAAIERRKAHDRDMLDSTQPTQSGIRSAGCRPATQLDARGNRCCGVHRRFLYAARLGGLGTIRVGTRSLPVGTTRGYVDSNGIPDLCSGRHHVPIGYRRWRADVDFAGEHFRCHRAGLVRDLYGGTAQSS